MADNQKQFDEFLSNIQLVGTGLDDLRKSRDANRDRIKEYWKETLERVHPTFDEQGSFAMGTVVKPVSAEEDYDLDDGMYLNCIGEDTDEWPSTEAVQDWIKSAVEGYTRESPSKKKRCVRVPYKNGYHVDIPVYGTDESGKVRVFEQGKDASEFSESNPVDLANWFTDQCENHDDLRDLVRFFKAWRDYKGGRLKKLKSVAVTIMIAKKIASSSSNGQAVVDTASACETHIRGGGTITKPVAPYDDLTEGWSDEDREKIADAFKNLAERGLDALSAESVRDGALIWQKQFGERFPVPEEDKEKAAAEALRTPHPQVVTSGTFA